MTRVWALVTVALTLFWAACTDDPVVPPSAESDVVAADSGAGVTAAVSDREALVALYQATDGPNWFNNDNWLTDAPLGEWFGVETDSLGRVVGLEMAYWDRDRKEWIANNLSGPLPAELGDLASLEYMQFFANSLTPDPPRTGWVGQPPETVATR